MQTQTQYLDTAEAAKVSRLSKSFLEKVRIYEPSKGPPFIRVGKRVLYAEPALHAWLSSRTVGGVL
jgi:hypothetical protein